MTRRDFLQASGLALATAAAGAQPARAGAKRPNILWITCEDISPHLGCYGYEQAATPNLDALAAQGVRYDNAFSVSGVCAPSRSCLITGMYPSSLGTCHMRCKNPPPEHVKCFPEYLRDAGYYCTNNRKTDYQFLPPFTAWDESHGKAHWRNRPDKDQPFFAVFNFTITHESQIGRLFEDRPDGDHKLPPEQRHDPAKADPPPYYPDTELMRKHWAHYYDVITVMDRQAGEILEQLEQDGLAGDTIVFFYGDHGAGLPRAKRWVYDAGLRVPLIVRWPGQPLTGAATDRLVSFVDFGPTVLSIAGVPVPDHMQGRPFLGGQETKPRHCIFGARDRMDERYDIIRTAHDGRFQYLRNYEPYRPYDQRILYCESWPVMQEMRRVLAVGEAGPAQKLFFRQRKPLEELYDLEHDPHELNNLASNPEFAGELARLRGALDRWLADIRDIGFVPEIELHDWLYGAGAVLPENRPVYAELADDAALFGRPLNDYVAALNGDDPLERLRAVKTLSLVPEAAAPVLEKAWADPQSGVAFWAATGLGDQGGEPDDMTLVCLRACLERPEPAPRLAAAWALCRLGRPAEGLPAALDAMRHANDYVRLYAAQILETVKEEPEARVALETALEDKNGYVVSVAKTALGLPRR